MKALKQTKLLPEHKRFVRDFLGGDYRGGLNNKERGAKKTDIIYIYNSRSFLTDSKRYIHNMWKKQTKLHVQTICYIIQVRSRVL